MLKIIYIVALILFILILIITFHAYRKLFCRKKRTVLEEMQNLIDKNLISRDYYASLYLKNISIKTSDNYNICGYLTSCKNPIGCIILSHGISCNHATMLHHVEFFKNQNYDVLLVDQRGHGNSDLTISTYGFKEKEDISLWIVYLRNIGYKKIGIMGHSMGASIALLTCSEPVNPDFVISESAYSNLKDLIKFNSEDMKLLSPLIIFNLNLICKVLHGFSLEDIDVLKAIKPSNIPILFIHGDKDELIPFHMSTDMRKATNNDIYIVKNCGHNIYNNIDSSLNEYENKIESFLNKV